jgi:hypothetical protein
MAAPTKQALQGYGLVRRWPRRKLADVKLRAADNGRSRGPESAPRQLQPISAEQGVAAWRIASSRLMCTGPLFSS